LRIVRNYLLVFTGGGLGATARYWLSAAVYRWLPPDFPYGNLVVNISGCFVIGFLASALEERFIVTPALRIFLTVGILGGFTTFSSFSYEAVGLLRQSAYLSALWYIGGSLFGCLLATTAGLFAGRLL
jgi:fluoride exporter